MRTIQRWMFLIAAVVVLWLSLPMFAQDEPSLGDAARQARQQKQQKESLTKDAGATDAAKDSDNSAGVKTSQTNAQPVTKAISKTPRVITNEEIPSHLVPAATSSSAHSATTSDTPGDDTGVEKTAEGISETNAESVRSQILTLKNEIESMQGQMDSLNESIHFAPANCVSNCAQWNERQLQKQQQVDQMKAQLEDAKKKLEDMQDAARQKGFGSSVYEP